MFIKSPAEKLFNERSLEFKYVTNSKVNPRNKFFNYSVKVLVKSENEFWVPFSDGKDLAVGYVLIDNSNGKQYVIKECGMETAYFTIDKDPDHPFACRKLTVELKNTDA